MKINKTVCNLKHIPPRCLQLVCLHVMITVNKVSYIFRSQRNENQTLSITSAIVKINQTSGWNGNFTYLLSTLLPHSLSPSRARSLITRRKSVASRFACRENREHNPLLRPINGDSGEPRCTESVEFLDLQRSHQTFPLRRSNRCHFETSASSPRSEAKEAKVNEYARGQFRSEKEFQESGQGEADR